MTSSTERYAELSSLVLWCPILQGEGRPGSGCGPAGKGQEGRARLGTEEWEWNGGQRVQGQWGRAVETVTNVGEKLGTGCHGWGMMGGSQQVPVGHGLNEEGLVLRHGPPPGLLGGVVHGKHIIAVHADGQDAVPGASSRCGDRPARPQGSVET